MVGLIDDEVELKGTDLRDEGNVLPTSSSFSSFLFWYIPYFSFIFFNPFSVFSVSTLHPP